MKHFWILTAFAIGALCFVVFVKTVKPDAISAVPASSKPEYCSRSNPDCAPYGPAAPGFPTGL